MFDMGEGGFDRRVRITQSEFEKRWWERQKYSEYVIILIISDLLHPVSSSVDVRI